MNKLTDSIWVEKYRPQDFNDLIFNSKYKILALLKTPMSIPSFLFVSSSPGTGKTTCAKLIAKYLNCDSLFLNASDERGIDTIRGIITEFACAQSSNSNSKRMVFLDEMDGLTISASDCLKSPMESFSNNCFFILACNDVSKIIPAIQSRCMIFQDFDSPSKKDILKRLEYISEQEKLKMDIEILAQIVDNLYPDIRSMINCLQSDTLINTYEQFNEFLNLIKAKKIKEIYDIVYSGKLDIRRFNTWFFSYLFNHGNEIGYDKVSQMVIYLAETEKQWTLGVNQNIIFVTNIINLLHLF